MKLPWPRAMAYRGWIAMLDAQVRHPLAQLDHHDVGIGVLRPARAQVINVEIDGLGQVLAVHVPQQVEQSGALQKPTGGTAMQSRQDGVAYQFFLEWQDAGELLALDINAQVQKTCKGHSLDHFAPVTLGARMVNLFGPVHRGTSSLRNTGRPEVNM